MNKMEIKKLTSIIKGYYNSQFFVDDYVLDAWYDCLKDYDINDAIEHIQDYIKEYPDTPPRPHTFRSGLLTIEEKERRKNVKYTVECNLCHRFMPYEEYEEHYSKCLDIQYLVSVAKNKGKAITREELENQKNSVIDDLLKKYPPEKLTLEEAFERI